MKAMAICTRHSFIEIFKARPICVSTLIPTKAFYQPVLLMALDDYFANPSQDCLARLFDAVNSIDISKAPVLSRFEKLIMRTSERKDVFIEKFEEPKKRNIGENVPGTAKPGSLSSKHNHQQHDSIGSHSSFEDGILTRGKDKGKEKERKTPGSSLTSLQQPGQHSPSEPEFSLDGSAVWVGDESGLDQVGVANHVGVANNTISIRGRSSTDASSSSSLVQQARREEPSLAPTVVHNPASLKDTHFFPATMDYNDHLLPIRLPLSTFPEEVGDVSFLCVIVLPIHANPLRSIHSFNSCKPFLLRLSADPFIITSTPMEVKPIR